jgi:anti-sigma-K factor RskA
MADHRSVEAIEQDLADARQRLTENISRFVTEVHPRAVTHRAVQEHKSRVKRGLDDVKAQVKQSSQRVLGLFKDESGWRPVPVAVAIVAGVIVVVAATKKK